MAGLGYTGRVPMGSGTVAVFAGVSGRMRPQSRGLSGFAGAGDYGDLTSGGEDGGSDVDWGKLLQQAIAAGGAALAAFLANPNVPPTAKPGGNVYREISGTPPTAPVPWGLIIGGVGAALAAALVLPKLLKR